MTMERSVYSAWPDLDTVELTHTDLRYREPILLAEHGKKFRHMSAESGEIFRKPWVAREWRPAFWTTTGAWTPFVNTMKGRHSASYETPGE